MRIYVRNKYYDRYDKILLFPFQVHLLTVVCLSVLHVTYSASVGYETPEDIDVPPEPAQSCSVCAPGYGVIALCNGIYDTQCAECPPGTYNDAYTVDQPCRPCNSCPDGYYERTPCINFQDVNCAKCYKNGGGFGNEDFLRKCETTTTSTTTPPSTLSEKRTTNSIIFPPLPPQNPSTKMPLTVETSKPKELKTTSAPTVNTVTPRESHNVQKTTVQVKPPTTAHRLKPLPPMDGEL